ncbi:MAG TPA: alpha-L-rhamnosidase N-terminal domain-containing protein, partial [Thermomicrobiales bacterium]|nr:alpha-L-rhamnosidase N-terminal domain-containing protein [Thermomicrobiales bacterium]
MHDVMEKAAPDSVATGWVAEMIRPLSDQGVGTPASFVSKTFRLDRVGGREVLRISALGLYRCFINGRRVGHDLLTPGWTAYDKRLSFQTYLVADLLVPGENEISIWLGDGWLRSQLMWGKAPIFNTWGEHIAAIAELRAAPEDRDPILVTDASWQSGELPIRKSGIY